MEGKRINKYISETGMCSRREADKLIENGAVTINGKRAQTGDKIVPGNKVQVYGETVAGGFVPVIIAFNKPVGVVSTTDPQERDNIVNTISFEERIFPIGRLDKDSQGLILLTNEGDIVNKILRAGNNHDKEYIVTVDKAINEDFIKKMQSGIPILGVVTRKCEVKQIAACVFSIVLRQGLNRQIRRMCEFLNYQVVKLERIRIMHIQLGNLKQGQFRELTKDELDQLRENIALSIQTEEGSKTKKKVHKPKAIYTETKDKENEKGKPTEAKKKYGSRDSKSFENHAHNVGKWDKTVEKTERKGGSKSSGKSGSGSGSGSASARNKPAPGNRSYAGAKTSYAGTKTTYAGTKTSYAGTKTSYAGTKTSYAGTKTTAEKTGHASKSKHKTGTGLRDGKSRVFTERPASSRPSSNKGSRGGVFR
ncbi:hypothetical protein AwDysgo_17100 [Bacteroidales bacterium]|nr:hypothetical protein AwDysgo_17100 [Bacteroidales bacterium]